MSDDDLPPLRFRPHLVARPWGGTALQRLLQRSGDVGVTIGESWELSDLPGHVSCVAEGVHAGTSLRTLVERYPDQLLGISEGRVRGDGRFPLLVKFLDVADRLSLQVHPNDDLARRREGLSRGKSEAWWVMEAQPEAFVLLGSRDGLALEEVRSDLESGRLERLTTRQRLEAGDLVRLPAGTLHAAGGGAVMLEIQDTCDVTYRLHDWGRVDSQGRGRPLHLEAGLEALNLSHGGKGEHRSAGLVRPGLLADLGGFELWLHEEVAPGALSVAARDVPVVVVVVDGNGCFSGGNGGQFRRGDVFLFPAGEGSMIFLPGAGELLRVVEARPSAD